MRYTRLSRNGYTEDAASAGSPLTYSQLTDEATTITAGIRFTDKISKTFKLIGGGGLEQDISHSVGNIFATGLSAGDTEVALNSNIRRTRVAGALDGYYNFDDTHQIKTGVSYHQSSFNDASTVTASISYIIGF